MIKLLALVGLWSLLATGVGSAQDFRAVARLDAAASGIVLERRSVEITLKLSQAVPWRALLLEGTPRLALEFSELALEGLTPDALRPDARGFDLRFEHVSPGWSRMVLDLNRPYAIASAEMRGDPGQGGTTLIVRLKAASQEDYDAEARSDTAQPLPAVPRGRQMGERPLVVALDPGHGGFDPGARKGGYSEAVLMLTFARELREKLIRTGRYEVVLTRNDDRFVSLPERVSIARRAEADVFLSLHADALVEGRATGATVYTLSEEASDEASAVLAGRLDRADLVAGIDLTSADDSVARALMDLARAETRPRTEGIADHLVRHLSKSLGGMYKRPRLGADFSVLKAPDIPSVLIELGFISSQSDLDKLLDPAWRDKAAQGIQDALDAWAIADAAEAHLVRQ